MGGSDTFAPVHSAGGEDGWDNAAEPLPGPRRHQRFRVRVVDTDAA